MTQKELSELTDEELLAEAKKMKSASIINATLIGAMIGIIIYCEKHAWIFYFNPLVSCVQIDKKFEK